MTRLLTLGWETGDINEAASTFTGNITQAVVTSTPTPRSPGTYCYKLAATGAQSGIRVFTLAASKTDLWVRLGIYVHFTGEHDLVAFNDSAGTIHGCVTYSPSDQLIKAYRGNMGTLLGTSSPSQMTADAWHTLDIRWQITSTSVGIVEVWVDGVRWINLTSVDNTNTTNANVQRVALGPQSNNCSSGEYVAFDDLAINDTSGTINNGQVGDGRVVFLKPTGAGSNTNQTRGGTDSGANWSQVDELPPSLTDYVYSATAAIRDTYALQDVPAGNWTINCVEVLAYAQNSDAGAGSLGLTVKSGTTTNEATAQSLTTSGAYYRQLYETDPNTSSAWTVAAVTALEAGTTVR